MSRKLKEYRTVGRFEIIDNFNHQFVENIDYAEAIKKYGECEVYGSYTNKSVDVPDADGNTPSWYVAVWLDIPGMKIGPWNGKNLHLRFIGDENDATFIGKKTGCLITVHRNDYDDYEAWWRSESERDDETAGCSVRGTAEQIIDELEGEI